MGDFVVSARKYRPVRFTDVVGQEHVTHTLKNALKSNQLAHAFLFCGPRGVGKTTCARILAKVINCQQPTADHEPCLQCSSCLAFQENASFNITELDAASNNTVEHIRTLIEQVRFQPQQGQYKVFIIDEVHMLSSSAFNAFLKTLEEPPGHAIFILATTEKHKILPTIISRCQIYEFRRILPMAIVPHLRDICQRESIEADEEALHLISSKAEGALRDALSIFDRIVAFSGNTIRYADVVENLNVLDYDYYFQIVEFLLTANRQALLLVLDELLAKGFDEELFMQGLAEHFRNLLVSQDARTLGLLEVSEGLRGRYQEQATLAPADFLLTAMNLADLCMLNARLARNRRLHLEIALLKMAHIHLQLHPQTADRPAEEKKKPESSLSVPSPEAPHREKPSPLPVETPATAPVREMVKVTVGESGMEEVSHSAQEGISTASWDLDSESVRELDAEVGGEIDLERGIGQDPRLGEIPVPEIAGEKMPISPPKQGKDPVAAPVGALGKVPETRVAKDSARALQESDVANHSLLGRLMLEVREEAEPKEPEIPAPILDSEALQIFQDNYAEELTGDAARILWKAVRLAWEPEDILQATVTSALQENALREDKVWMERLRIYFRRPDLILQIRLDRSEIPEPNTGQKAESQREILARFHATNPAIRSLAERLSLVLGEE